MIMLTVSPLAARQSTYRSDGGVFEAELVDVRGGKAVLERPDGTQFDVPIGKLSLGDIRYIKTELEAAETGLGGGAKGAKDAGAASEPASPVKTPALKADPTVDASKLRYQWQKGQELVYRVKVVGTQGDYSENISGRVTYKVKSVTDDEAEIEMVKSMSRSQSSDRVGVVVYSGRGPRFRHGPSRSGVAVVRFFTIPKSKNKTSVVTLTRQGRMIHVKNDAPLPYLLGNLSELVFEPFSTPTDGVWSTEAVSTIEVSPPFRRYVRGGNQTGVPANEKTTYTILDQSDDRVTIAKCFELTTTAQLNGKPQFQASGNGKLVFDVACGAFSSMTYDVLVTARRPAKTEEVPFHVTYQLVTEAELAAEKKAAEEQRIAREKAKEELRRPMTDVELDAAVADLSSGDQKKVGAAMKLFIAKAPRKPSVKALEEAMRNLDNNSGGIRADAAKALKVWGSQENVRGLIAALGDEWVGTRNAAMGTLAKFKSAEAAAPMARLLVDGGSRGAAEKALKSLGPAAEDAVLPLVANDNAWTAASACKVLQSVGTKKSLDVLKKPTKQRHWMITNAAAAAVRAIELRESMKPK